MENFIEFLYQFTKIIQGILYFMLAMVGAGFIGKMLANYKTNNDPKTLKLLHDAWATIGAQEQYIRKLESQISRDKESVVMEGKNET